MPFERALEQFQGLRQVASTEELQRLGRRVSTHVDAIAEAALSEPDLPVDLARRLADGLLAMSAEATAMDSSERAIVHAAVRYFLLTLDADDDLASAHGLDDDVYVFNEACRLLDRSSLQVKS